MARADLLIELIKTANTADSVNFHKTVEILIAEERSNGKHILAERMHKALRPIHNGNGQPVSRESNTRPRGELFYEITPERSLESLFLPSILKEQVQEVVEEQHRGELLHSHNLKARHRFLFTGSPGNGKTTLAEAIAYELMYPLIVIRYETLIGSYLGETSGRIKAVLEYAKTQRCVLFFDEFDTLGKERGDNQETGEIKRVVSSLLLQTDALPDYVVLIAASNHPELLDRAIWRRFQVKMELRSPNQTQTSQFIKEIAKRCDINFGDSMELAKSLKGLSYAEIEGFCLDVARRAVLTKTSNNTKDIVARKLRQWKSQIQSNTVSRNI